MEPYEPPPRLRAAQAQLAAAIDEIDSALMEEALSMEGPTIEFPEQDAMREGDMRVLTQGIALWENSCIAEDGSPYTEINYMMLPGSAQSGVIGLCNYVHTLLLSRAHYYTNVHEEDSDEE